MDPSPDNRIIEAAAFQNIAVDFTGPYSVNTSNNGIQKRWICLFACLTTTAVHLELMKGLSAEDFLLAYKRFTVRRGVPQTMISDNAEQLKEASKLINTEWKFTKLHTSWKKGVYKVVVKLLAALKKIVDQRLLTEREFRDVLIQTGNIINSRPVTEVKREPPLFLKPGCVPSPATTQDQDEEEDEVSASDTESEDLPKLIQRMETLEICGNELWSIWRQEYQQYSRGRQGHRKHVTIREPKVDDIVLVSEKNVPKPLWKMARITELIRNENGAVASAIVRMPRTDLSASIPYVELPIWKLYSLGLNASEPQQTSDSDEADSDSKQSKRSKRSDFYFWTNIAPPDHKQEKTNKSQ